MTSRKLCFGWLVLSTLAIGCRPRVPKIPETTTAKNADGSVSVTHRHLKIAVDGPRDLQVDGASPTELSLSWRTNGWPDDVLVKAPDELTPMTQDEWKVDAQLRGSSFRVLESKDTEGGGFNATYTYRNKKFDQMAAYYSVQQIGAEKLVCSYAGSANGARIAKRICESIRAVESPAATSPSSDATIAAAPRPGR